MSKPLRKPFSSTPPSESDWAWAAGLFEGEGFLKGVASGRDVGCQMRLGMTDRDVVERFAATMGCGKIYSEKRKAEWKEMHTWIVARASELVPALEALVPFFGQRRRQKAEEVLLIAKGLNSPAGERTHCPRGHPYSGDNLIVRKSRWVLANGEVRHGMGRWCKACRDEKNAARFA